MTAGFLVESFNVSHPCRRSELDWQRNESRRKLAYDASLESGFRIAMRSREAHTGFEPVPPP
jgi:hypothetical protein